MDIEELPGGRSLLKRQESSAFGGLLGSTVGRRRSLAEAGDLLAAAKLATIPNVHLRLVYDEDEYPNIDIDFQIFVFDKRGGYLDCVCSRNPSMPGLTADGMSMSVLWCDLPVDCSVLILSIVTNTPGMSVSDLSGAYVAVTTAESSLPPRQIHQFRIDESMIDVEGSAPALFLGMLAEVDNDWGMYSDSKASTDASPHVLIKDAKQIAEEFVRLRQIQEPENFMRIKPPVSTADIEHLGTGPPSPRAFSEHEDKDKAIAYAQRMGRKVMANQGSVSELKEKLQQRRDKVDAESSQGPTAPKATRATFAGVSDDELRVKLSERRTAIGHGSFEAPAKPPEETTKPPKADIDYRIKGYRSKDHSNAAKYPVRAASSDVRAGNSDVTQFSKLIQNLTSVELSVSALELSVEQSCGTMQSMRDGIERLESRQRDISNEATRTNSTNEERMTSIENQVKETNKKLDVLLSCFKEAGYIE